MPIGLDGNVRTVANPQGLSAGTNDVGDVPDRLRALEMGEKQVRGGQTAGVEVPAKGGQRRDPDIGGGRSELPFHGRQHDAMDVAALLGGLGSPNEGGAAA